MLSLHDSVISEATGNYLFITIGITGLCEILYCLSVFFVLLFLLSIGSLFA